MFSQKQPRFMFAGSESEGEHLNADEIQQRQEKVSRLCGGAPHQLYIWELNVFQHPSYLSLVSNIPQRHTEGGGGGGVKYEVGKATGFTHSGTLFTSHTFFTDKEYFYSSGVENKSQDRTSSTHTWQNPFTSPLNYMNINTAALYFI